MDTRYWGPSGWRLLHLISFGTKAARADLCAFFEVLPYVLPCRYCRKSLSEYMRADPVDCALRENRLAKWLWRIHNDVNAKLRAQGLKAAAAAIPDPPFQHVAANYKALLAVGCSRTRFEGWDFLFSVAESHPLGRAARAETPMPGAPAADVLAAADPLERNRWNAMSPEERLGFYANFWRLLPRVFPFEEWTAAWRRAAAKLDPPSCRADCVRGLWSVRRAMEHELELQGTPQKFSDLCLTLRTVRSGCGSASTNAARRKTCRRKRGMKG